MTSFIRELLPAEIAGGDSVLVFPSQVAADAWALEYLRSGIGRALDPGRFLGWDSFKEAELTARGDEKPANRVTRSLWAAGVVARQARSPFLAAILGSGPPSAAFVGFLAKLPPSLAGIATAARAGGGRLRQDRIIADLVLLEADYAAFLRERRLFEPSWRPPRRPELGRPHLILAPELIEDFEDYRPVLEGADYLRLLPLPAGGSPAPLLRFENAWDELRSILLAIGELLDGGTAPEDIGLTVADLDGARPWLEAAARRAGVPLAVRRGRSLDASPFGRLLSAIGAAADADFGLVALEALLHDRFATWKERENADGLLRFGVERHAFASYAREGRTVDIWEESFRVTEVSSPLVSFYRRLRAASLAVAGARDFAALRTALTAFRNQFLDESGWDEAEGRLVERSMEELDALARAEAEFGGGIALPSPFALFLSSLGSVTYVPQARGSFVSAYPWRVSALLPFKVHFLAGCGFDRVRVAYGEEPFLRDDQREALGRLPRDATEAFLRAYLHSGDLVRPCHAEEEIGGWSAPHPFFAEVEAGEAASRASADPLVGEAAFFRGESARPPALLPAQKRAFTRALALDRRADPRFGKLGDTAISLVESRASREGLLRLSATLVEDYRQCPFRWLVRRGLGVPEPDLELGFFDARLAGEMAHRALERLFEGIAALGPVAGTRANECLRLAREAPGAILPDFVRKHGPFLEPMFEAWAPLLGDRLRRLVLDLLEDPGWESGELELDLRMELPELGAVLEGRIDRLARRDGEFAIVDYKKKNLPRKEDLVLPPGPEGPGEAGEAAPELGNIQMASYISLVEASGRRVTRVSFRSIEDAKDLVVVGEGGLKPAGGYGPELAAFRRALETAAGGIRSGRFPYAPPSSKACEGCTARSLCRSHYSVR